MDPAYDEIFKPGVTTPVSTFSIVVGDMVLSRCQAHCPGCVSRMTRTSSLSSQNVDQHLINWRKNIHSFKAACRFAKTSGVTTVLFTSKGEPTLYKDEISAYLNILKNYEFPFIEIQTNGISMGTLYDEEGCVTSCDLEYWQKLGLTHIALSIAHWDNEKNHKFYGSKRMLDLENLILQLSMIGFSVRVCCLLMKDYVDTINDFKGVVALCNSWGARQLKITPIARPVNPENKEVAKWVDEHIPQHSREIADHIMEKGHYLRTLPHGAPIFNYEGLSVCVSECLPVINKVGNGIQPIFWPNGSLTYSWEHQGAILL
jgi:MoaA/NifB/PqqE/SkfB family radical SAM enzyme